MPYDIYGSNLRSGHCEVHPWVHEEYPCGVCFADQQRYEMQKQKEQEYWEKVRAADEAQQVSDGGGI